jgi:hypothetical protein
MGLKSARCLMFEVIVVADSELPVESALLREKQSRIQQSIWMAKFHDTEYLVWSGGRSKMAYQ